MNKTKVKICSLCSVDDARFAAEQGADFLGFIFVPGTPRDMGPEEVRKIVAGLPAGPKTVGVFRNRPLDEVMEIMSFCKLDIAQLHGDENEDFISALGPERCWKVFHLCSEEDVEQAVSSLANKVLADAAAGGSGEACDWKLAASLANRRDIILAGGLIPENVLEAIDQVMPFAVDVSSGVEAKKRVKDHQKIKEFIMACQSGYARTRFGK